MTIQNILVPLDGSELSLAALAHAEKLAAPLGARLILMRVGQALAPEALGIPELSMAFTSELTLHQAKVENSLIEYLEHVAAPLRERGLTVECEAAIGEPAHEIVAMAESEKVDLVVMTSHGRTGLQRWIYGSVAERVLHNANCSLMVVRIDKQHLQ